MIVNGEYQMATVNKLAFNRQSGTQDERRAALLIQEEIASFGGTSTLETFPVPRNAVKKVSLKVTEPFARELEVHAIAYTGSTPEDGIEAEFCYVEDASDMKLKNAAGKILLMNETVYKRWEQILKSGALGYIITSGNHWDDLESTDLAYPRLYPRYKEMGQIPGVVIRTRDAIELLKAGASRVALTVVQEESEGESANVVAEITGTSDTDEFVVLSAHYDSVPFSRGAWDNASGSADLLALYAYFKENTPAMNMRFVWCGSEEVGRMGSKAYVEAHKAELEKCRLNLNLDMTGLIMGADVVDIIGEESFAHMLEYMARECGFDAECKRTVRSSDCAVFADAGIPAIDFVRRGKSVIHTRNDVEFPLSEIAFARTQTFMRQFLSRVLNAAEFPIPRAIPQDMKTELDKHWGRDIKK